MPAVLITREDATDFALALAQRGYQTEHFPTIAIAPLSDWQTPDLARYDALIFTSANAVRCFAPAFLARLPNALSALRQTPRYAVGEKTLRALRELGIENARRAEKDNADALAQRLKRDGISGKRFLFIRGNRARDVIPTFIAQNGGVCDELIVYETLDAASREPERLARLLNRDDLEWIAFFSPSAAESLFKALKGGAFPSRLKIAVIGETTKTAVEALGWRVDAIAATPSAEALAEAIAKSDAR